MNGEVYVGEGGEERDEEFPGTARVGEGAKPAWSTKSWLKNRSRASQVVLVLHFLDEAADKGFVLFE